MKKRTLLSWSSGKDSAWTLHTLKQETDIEIVGLFSTFNSQFDRVAMHSVRIELVKQQAESAGYPIRLIPIPYPCSNEQYESIMKEFIKEVEKESIEYFAFGDLFLESVRQYREKNLSGSGIKPLFPIWGKDTLTLSRKMLDAGLKARITCVDPKQLSPAFAGKEYNNSFLEQLPGNADPCGENGEFHSFVYDGPFFNNKINIRIGETVSRDGFIFTDLLPK